VARAVPAALATIQAAALVRIRGSNSDHRRGDVMSLASEEPGPSAVVLQHRDDAPGGLLIDVLAAAGFRSRIVRVDCGEPLPNPTPFTLAVTLGCDDAVDGQAMSPIDAELDWLRQADRSGSAVLGVGSGAQTLALAFGGDVERAPRAQHGWVWISSSIPGWISPGPWLAWQRHVICLPPNAQLLAHNQLGPQAYSVGGHLGVQFHPEVTPKILCDWVTASRAASLDAQGTLEVASREYATASAGAHRLLSTYVDSLARRRH
jgi:GMP synthase-like glutamine amidotransferase